MPVVSGFSRTLLILPDPTIAEARRSIERVTDEELVLLARQGDPDAFDQLVARHQSAVYRAALAALRVREDAEEVAQDAFIRAWRALAEQAKKKLQEMQIGLETIVVTGKAAQVAAEGATAAR